MLLYYWQVNLESWDYSGDLKVSTGKTKYKYNAKTYFVYYNMLKTGADSKFRRLLPTFMRRKRSCSYSGMTSMIFKPKKGKLILNKTEI